ncbi:type I polyketide synthase [Nocardioides solisilvae]|uniref:type I polyketide synthase n=1 Tax=Nocardioides solisilvae TaxID=1542435 RepID=UPI000D74EC38|nr:type I polyketide synthase [Nocardioides solisilvae]
MSQTRPGTTLPGGQLPGDGLVVAADPCGEPNPGLVAAAHRAGGIGLLDVADDAALATAVADLRRRRTTSCWLRPGASVTPAAVTGTVTGPAGGPDADAGAPLFPVVVLPLTGPLTVTGTSTDPATLAALVADWAAEGRTLVAQVTSREEARAAVEAGFDGLLASGREAGGVVGPTEAFILFQQVVDLGVPVWLRGGIGLRTAPAVVAGGGAGVVLDTQLGLLRESALGPAARQALAAMDGSETRVVGGVRFFTRPDLPAASLEEQGDPAAVRAMLGPDLHRQLVPFGQDSGAAADLAQRFVTVGGVVQAVRAAVAEHLAAAAEAPPLAPGAGIAAAHGTRYPIAQGPMTRVSDRAAFAAAVAEGGGLPFLALALLPAHEVRALLTETAELLGDRPWGVGVLGFAPAELRAEQLEVIHEVAPPVALIAGGRPSQAAPLEDAGIATYLHVPSPGLLARFLKDGARSFVFEGRECGGHVGPRSSLALWDAQVERLMALDDVSDVRVLLAGGVHDARSAAMTAAVLAPLAARGAQVGVLMGTAYLFTTEAVDAGAIQPAFQEVAVEADTTVLLETAPGHATRCVETDFVRAFARRKADLEEAGAEASARWAELEELNLGRLRIASKGLVRGADGLEPVDPDRQRAQGMYMIGEVATLRDEVTTVAALHAEVSLGSAALATEGPAGSRAEAGDRYDVSEPDADPFDIAVIGMESFFPGSTSADEFWATVLSGRSEVTEVPADRWDPALFHDADAYTKKAGRLTPSKWGGFLDRIGFDPLAYGIPPASLAAIEPVQLLSLEVARRALADAGYASRHFDRERASVVFGAESGNELGSAYGVRSFLPQLLGEVPGDLDEWLPTITEDSFPGVLANVIAGRIANRLDLGGVNFTVDAACGSSLAALDAACKELRTGQSDLVLAGGADLHNGLNDYLMFSSVKALSPTGRCRTFDASADGIALGEGIACVVLKRRVDAERDGDRIYAVIDAVAGSSDGRHLGLTAPRKEGQQRAVVRALTLAGRSAAEVGLVEAHGTGTVVGDRTEMATLTELFAEAGVEPGSAVLGSVKSQIGHTKCAAGLAGLIKVVKAVHHGVLPPTAGMVEPNPYYDREASPFRFHDRPVPWADETRRAGVSAFGFGGTNFHALVSSYDGGDRPAYGADHWPSELFLLRGPDAEAGARAASELAEKVAAILASDPTGQRHRLRDLAATVARSGRGPVQVALVADSLEELATQLGRVAGGSDARHGVFVAAAEAAALGEGAAAPKVGFLYPGQGSQRPGMLQDLFVTFGGLDDLLRLGSRWRDTLFPPTPFSREQRAAQQAAITATDVAQPTLGIAALAVTRLLGRLGVRPDVAGGHSYGELAALAAAGSLDDATLLELSAARGGAILESVERSGGDPGTMAAVALPVEEVTVRLEAWPSLVVANHNGPRQVVVSGPTDAVHEAVAALHADGVKATVIPVACAFHSPLVAEAGQLLANRLAELPVAAPRFPVWSNVTAQPYPEGDPDAVRRLLADQVTAGVRFVEQVESMYAAGVRVFVEAGPGRVLTQQVGKILGDRPHAMVATDASGEPGLRRFLAAVGQLAALGVPVDPTALFEGRAEVLDLPGLPLRAPAWTVDGAFVRGADGTPVRGSFQPATTMPALSVPAPAAPVQSVAQSVAPGHAAHPQGAPVTADLATGALPAPDDAVSAVVQEYLRGLREVVAGQREVMLRYLGAEAPAGTPGLPALPPLAGAAPAVASAAATAASPPGASAAPAPSAPAVAAVAPAVAAPAAATADAPSARAGRTTAELLAAVQGVVSDRTGYPVDMLDPDLDLEADLSIDSIKRIEIVGELAERVGLGGVAGGAGGAGSAGGADALDESVVEELARHKTLSALVGWIEAQQGATPAAAPVEAPAAAPAPAPAAESPAPAAAAAASPALSGAALLAAVQGVVSDRTGYPVEMLDPDLDLEADLSIDSIKRIEIVGELAERVGLGGVAGGAGAAGSAGGADALDESVVEELARHKTLRALVGWIEAQQAGPAEALAPAAAPVTSPVVAPVVAEAPAETLVGAPVAEAPATPESQEQHEAQHAEEPVAPTTTHLFEVRSEPLGPTVPFGDLSGSHVVLHAGHPGLTAAVEEALRTAGAAEVRVAGRDGVPLDTSALDTTGLRTADVLVDLSATGDDPTVDARRVFAGLRPALAGRARRVLAVGVALHADGAPTGVAGLLRSLARERTDVLLRSVEVAAADLRDEDLAPLAATLVDELLDLDAPTSLSWVGGHRASRTVGPARTLAAQEPALPLDADSVVVVTGGARGITARVAEAFARRSACRLVLVGRSPLPEAEEDPRTASAPDARALRRTLLATGELRTPAEVEAACSRILAAREMRATISSLRALGSEVEYVALDVRSARFGLLLDDLHARHGRVDGVVHGAGVLEDRLARDKTDESFDRVFGTKVDGAEAILSRLHLGMRFVVLFGSVSGVFGNRGQVDYAAANDALDTLARAHDGRQGCRVLSLDWGPWAGGGMVSPELTREYARRGIGLLDPADGVRALLQQVAAEEGPAQLVVMCGDPQAFAPELDRSALAQALQLQDSRTPGTAGHD